MGWPHPDYLLEFLSPVQWRGWCEFYDLEPWGFPVADIRAGILGATIANSAGAKTQPKDFMLGKDAPEESGDPFEQFVSVFKPEVVP